MKAFATNIGKNTLFWPLLLMGLIDIVMLFRSHWENSVSFAPMVIAPDNVTLNTIYDRGTMTPKTFKLKFSFLPKLYFLAPHVNDLNLNETHEISLDYVESIPER